MSLLKIGRALFILVATCALDISPLAAAWRHHLSLDKEHDWQIICTLRKTINIIIINSLNILI